jgi:hypothetical protein
MPITGTDFQAIILLFLVGQGSVLFGLIFEKGRCSNSISRLCCNEQGEKFIHKKIIRLLVFFVVCCFLIHLSLNPTLGKTINEDDYNNDDGCCLSHPFMETSKIIFTRWHSNHCSFLLLNQHRREFKSLIHFRSKYFKQTLHHHLLDSVCLIVFLKSLPPLFKFMCT